MLCCSSVASQDIIEIRGVVQPLPMPFPESIYMYISGEKVYVRLFGFLFVCPFVFVL